jgi:hypothetical protein
MRLVEADQRLLDRWDDDIERCVNGTLFHRRDFLAYHGDRFAGAARDLVLLDGETPVAWLPMAVEAVEGRRVARSPYGASYGSFAFATAPTYARAAEAVAALLAYLEAEGVTRCLLTPPIACCADEPLDTFAFTLLEAGFGSVNRDVSSVVRLPADRPVAEAVTGRARWSARKAEAAGVEVVRGAGVEDFWAVMTSGYLDRGRRPTHQADELRLLTKLVPDRVWFDVGVLDGQPVAGVAHFLVTPSVDSSFYLCQDPAHADTQAVSLLLLRAIEDSQAAGRRYFDLGTSTAQMVARPNIFMFKEAFTRTGLFRETFEWTAER